MVGCNGVKRQFNSYSQIIAVSDAYMFPGFLTPVLTQLSFQSHWLLFSHALAEVRGKKPRERKFASNVEKGENAGNQYFLLFPQCFLSFQNQIKICILIHLVICRSFHFGQIKNFVIWLTLSQTSPGFYVSALQVFRKHCGKRRNCS